jgi:tetratricopeptide (TPR) repeat protein
VVQSVGRKLGGLLALTLMVGIVSPLVFAEEKEPPPPTTIDENTGKRLSEAIEFANQKQYAEAKATIGRLNFEKLSPYERSRAEQILASIAVDEDDYDAALIHIRNAIQSGGLSEPEIAQSEFQIAQILMAQEKWGEAIVALKGWLAKTPNANASVYYLLAVAYYQSNDYQSALAPAEKAISMAEKPQESWLQLLLALRIQREEYKLAIPLVKSLIALTPEKKTYWIQLSGMYAELEDYENAVIPLQLALRAGLLTEEGEIKRLADLLLYNQIPYRCGKTLTEAIDAKKVKADQKVMETLSNCWIASREYDKAIGPLTRAAEMSSDGRLFVRLGEVHVQRGEWAKATDALGKGVNAGNLKNLPDAQVLMGIAFYNQKKLKEAKTWFERARQSGKTKDQADGWIRHIDSELAAQ